jgi:hypothetical protein
VQEDLDGVVRTKGIWKAMKILTDRDMRPFLEAFARLSSEALRDIVERDAERWSLRDIIACPPYDQSLQHWSRWTEATAYSLAAIAGGYYHCPESYGGRGGFVPARQGDYWLLYQLCHGGAVSSMDTLIKRYGWQEWVDACQFAAKRTLACRVASQQACLGILAEQVEVQYGPRAT